MRVLAARRYAHNGKRPCPGPGARRRWLHQEVARERAPSGWADRPVTLDPSAVLVVAASDVVRRGLVASLRADLALDVLAESGSEDDALEVVAHQAIDVAVVAMSLTDRHGIEVCRGVLECSGTTQVVVAANHVRDADLLEAFEAGARGFVVLDTAPSVIVPAVLAVHSGGVFVDPAVAGRLVRLASKGRRVRGPHGLTVQEQRVLALLPQGLTNREIAQELSISPETVKTHLRRAFTKIGAVDRIQAADLARRAGLDRP